MMVYRTKTSSDVPMSSFVCFMYRVCVWDFRRCDQEDDLKDSKRRDWAKITQNGAVNLQHGME